MNTTPEKDKLEAEKQLNSGNTTDDVDIVKAMEEMVQKAKSEPQKSLKEQIQSLNWEKIVAYLLLLVLFPLAGIPILWIRPRWNKGIKIVLTVLPIVIFFSIFPLGFRLFQWSLLSSLLVLFCYGDLRLYERE